MSKGGVSIIGGGLSGLSVAFYLAQHFKKSTSLKDLPIHIFEKQKTFGGWLKSENVNGFIFERGPHSFRVDGQRSVETLNMMEHLGLHKDGVMLVNRTKLAPLFYHNKAICEIKSLPDMLLRQPMFRDFAIIQALTFCGLPHMAKSYKAYKDKKYYHQAGRRPAPMEHGLQNRDDYTVAEFFHDNATAEFVEVMAGAFIHGIYAGDINKLSIKSTFPKFYEVHQHTKGLIRGFMETKKHEKLVMEANLKKNGFSQFVGSMLQQPGTFSFANGMEELPKYLIEYMQRHSDNVKLHASSEIKDISFNRESNSKIKVQLHSNKHFEPAYVVNTTSHYSNQKLFPALAQYFNKCGSVDVVTVSLGWDQDQNANVIRNFPYNKHFGYLVPTVAQEPILGTIFHSNSFPEQGRKGLRLCLMMGGHHFDRLFGHLASLDVESQERHLEGTALRTISRHLGIDAPPSAILININRDCIPQMYVGHHQQMDLLRTRLKKEYDSKLWISNAALHGVALNDIIRGAHQVAQNIADDIKIKIAHKV